MEREKVFVKQDNMAVIHCTSCSQVKRICVGQFRDRTHIVRIKCPCGNNFEALLDFRQNYRKEVQMKGRCMVLADCNAGWHKLTVVNLSRTGIGIQVQMESLKMGEFLQLEFSLDDAKKTLIRKKAAIRDIRGKLLGCEFTETVEFEREIGFYLMT